MSFLLLLRRPPAACTGSVYCSRRKRCGAAGSSSSRTEGGGDGDGTSRDHHEANPEVFAASLREPQPRPTGLSLTQKQSPTRDGFGRVIHAGHLRTQILSFPELSTLSE